MFDELNDLNEGIDVDGLDDGDNDDNDGGVVNNESS